MALLIDASNETIRTGSNYPSGLMSRFSVALWATIGNIDWSNFWSTATGNAWRAIYTGATSTTIEIGLSKSGSAMAYATASGTIVSSQWTFLGWNCDLSRPAGDVHRLYIGTVGSPCVKIPWSATNEGSGSPGDPVGYAMDWGNPYNGNTTAKNFYAFWLY